VGRGCPGNGTLAGVVLIVWIDGALRFRAENSMNRLTHLIRIGLFDCHSQFPMSPDPTISDGAF